MIYASVPRRLGAMIIDLLLVCCISLPLWIWLMLSVRNTPPVPLEYLSLGLLCIWYVFSLLYFIGYWTWCGQTPGQMLVKVKVVRRDGRAIGFGLSIVRYLIGYTVDYLFLCLFIVPVIIPLLVTALQKQKRGIQDLIAGTLVIHVGEGGG